jgi:hypothetical protein
VAGRSHERLEELIAADALAGLDDADREAMLREMAEHGPDCPECLRLVSEYSEVAGRLAISLDPLRLSAGFEDRLREAARAARPPSAPEEPEVLPPGEARPVTAGGRGRRWWVTAAAVAAAVALLAGFVGYSLAPGQPQQAQFLTFLSQPSTKVVSLQGLPGQRISVALRPGATQAWVVASRLPTPPGDRVYELWFSRTGQDSVNPAGTFVPENGTALSRATLGNDVDLLAVTIEPPGGSPQPTMTPIFASPT